MAVSRSSLATAAASVAAAAFLLVGTFVFLRHQPRRIESVAVLPFSTPGGPGAEAFGDALTDGVINGLSRQTQVRVVPASIVERYKGPMDAERAGRELNVRAVLTGKLTQQGGELVVCAELVDVMRRSQIWGGRYVPKVLSSIESTAEPIAKDISEKVGQKLTGRALPVAERH